MAAAPRPFSPALNAWTLAQERCPHCGERGRLSAAAPGLLRCEACAFITATPREDTPPVGFDESLGLRPGALLRDRYRLIAALGRGAHGLTILAHHEFLNHPCVVKVLPIRTHSATDGAVQRLRAEASAGFRVSHPNVVRVLDCDASDGVWYFVMEYVDGADLAALPAAGVRLDWRQAVRIGIAAARGLDAIHRAGLVHRDVKPGNLLLGVDGQVHVADLGVARQHGTTPDGAPAERVGTLAYAAPEVFDGQDAGGPAADLYGLGATLYHLVTGRPARGTGLYRVLLRPAQTDTPWPDDAPPDVPPWFIAAVQRLLSPAPEARFESAHALAEYLEQPGTRFRATPPSAAAELAAPQGVVVLPLEHAAGADDDGWLGHAVADHLSRLLAQQHGAFVARLDQFLPMLQRVGQRSSDARGPQVLEAGRRIGAATVLEGRFERSGDQISLRVHAWRAGRATVAELAPLSGPLSALAALETRLAEQVAALLELGGSAAALPASPGRGQPAAEERFFRGKRAFLRGDYEQARTLGLAAVALDADFGEAIGFVGVCAARMGRYEEAADYNRRQHALAERLGDARLRVEADANLGSMHYFRGDYAAARACLESAAETAERCGLESELALIRNNLGFVLLQLGRPAEAEETYLKAIEAHKRQGALVSLIGPYNGLGHVLREQQRYEESRAYFRRALALAQESDDDVNMGVAYMNLGQSAILQGRLADAKHELAIALNILEHTSFWNGLARVYEYMAELNLRLGNCAEAVRCADLRLDLARRHANAPMEEAARQQRAAAVRAATTGAGGGRRAPGTTAPDAERSEP
jgi:tetratricopeptide (TPR) repeat protein/tRNA A-37 threonylcarbamoyl transferase component Bud32